MGVIADVVLAVAEVAVAPGAVTEFQLRVTRIRSAADGAAMGVSGGAFLPGLRAGEGDGASLFRRGFLSETPSRFDLPGHWDQISSFFSEKQEIVRQSHQGEEALGIHTVICGVGNDQISDIYEIEQSHQPRLDGDDIKEQKLGFRVSGGVAEDQAQIQEKCHIS